MPASVLFDFDAAWSTTSNSSFGQDIHNLKQNVVSTLLSWSQGYFGYIKGTFTIKFYAGEKVNSHQLTQLPNLYSQLNRAFTSITPLRPTLSPSAFKPSSSTIVTLEAAPLDLLPKISTHPALSTTQVRCGPRNTFSPSHFVRKRRHGFLSRVKTRKGRATLQRRKSKKRSTLSH